MTLRCYIVPYLKIIDSALEITLRYIVMYNAPIHISKIIGPS